MSPDPATCPHTRTNGHTLTLITPMARAISRVLGTSPVTRTLARAQCYGYSFDAVWDIYIYNYTYIWICVYIKYNMYLSLYIYIHNRICIYIYTHTYPTGSLHSQGDRVTHDLGDTVSLTRQCRQSRIDTQGHRCYAHKQGVCGTRGSYRITQYQVHEYLNPPLSEPHHLPQLCLQVVFLHTEFLVSLDHLSELFFLLLILLQLGRPREVRQGQGHL